MVVLGGVHHDYRPTAEVYDALTGEWHGRADWELPGEWRWNNQGQFAPRLVECDGWLVCFVNGMISALFTADTGSAASAKPFADASTCASGRSAWLLIARVDEPRTMRNCVAAAAPPFVERFALRGLLSTQRKALANP